MKTFLCIAFVVMSSFTYAQTDQEQVTQVIKSLFTGMETTDSALVRKAFYKEVTMATIATNKAGEAILVREKGIDNWLRAVGTPHPEVWSEEIWNLKISIDGEFAQAWCDYAFYIGKNFSHCGVDAFQLFKTPQGWKIFHLADTRRSKECNSIPASIQKKHQ